MGTIITTIEVYFTTDSGNNKILQCFPSGDIVVPPQTIATVTFNTIASPSGVHPQPKFVPNSVVPTGADKAKVAITQNSVTQSTQFVATINNSGTSVIDAGVAFKATYTTSTNPPPVIDGGSTIRNKGTSITAIWAGRVAAFTAGLFLGGLATWIARQLVMGPH